MLGQKQVYASRANLVTQIPLQKHLFERQKTEEQLIGLLYEVKLWNCLNWIINSTSNISLLGSPALRTALEFEWKMSKSDLSKDTLLIVYIAIEALIAVMATLGNALVIWVVRLIPANQNTTFYFIVSLALADIAVGLLVIPLAIVVSLGVMMHFYACLLVCSLLMVFSHASILSLMAIAIDRYLRVKFPTK